ncbi:MAG: hypothetical protein HCAMLNBO_01369 [Candidatus Brocadia fulgida]|nr:hypothetical protein [Candidatus Brocadia fulgida]
MQSFQSPDQFVPPPLIQPAFKDALLHPKPEPLQYLIHPLPFRVGGDVIHHGIVRYPFHRFSTSPRLVQSWTIEPARFVI